MNWIYKAWQIRQARRRLMRCIARYYSYGEYLTGDDRSAHLSLCEAQIEEAREMLSALTNAS